MSAETPSLLVCGPLISDLDAAHLARIRSALVHTPQLAELRQAVTELPGVWSLLAGGEPSLERVHAAPLLQAFAEWINKGNSSGLLAAGQSSRNTRLAVLTVLSHLAEYVTFLRSFDAGAEEDLAGELDEHTKTLGGLQDGGVQGLCVGMLSASALACARNTAEVAELGAVAVRLAMCSAAFVDLDQVQSSDPTVCVSARLPRNAGEGDEQDRQPFQEALESYPEAYIGVRMDVAGTTITATKSITGPLTRHLEEQGAMTKEIDLKGRFHYPGHEDALQKLVRLCESTPMLQFPQNRYPLVPLRQTITGDVVTDETPLHETVLRCILTETADWHTTMTRAVSAFAGSPETKSSPAGSRTRLLVQLGIAECIPRSVLAGIPSIRVLQPTTSKPARPGHYPDDAIAVIGMSCRFPDAETPEHFWEIIQSGAKAGSVFPDVGSFDCGLFRKSPREAEYMDPQHRLALHLAYEALEAAGHFSPSSSSTDDVGCYVGMSSCDYEDHVNARPPTAFSFTGTARAFASGRISHFFGLTGPSVVVDTACSSSGVAIHTACRAVLSGECAVALAGGVNLMTDEGHAHQNLAGASFLSPTGQCRPFDAAADGYRRGQGGGFVLLKRLSAAVADNDRVLGVIAASAVNNSKGNRSITLPSSESQSRLYRQVLGSAKVHPSQVSYVEAHGTGTQKGDPVECQSIRSVFGGNNRAGSSSPIRLGSVKGNLGHGEAASGIASLVKVLLMLQHGVITPQANFSMLNPAIPPLEGDNMEIIVSPASWRGPFRTALVNNYGASGANAAMVVCQAPSTHISQIASTRTAMTTTHRYPFVITANTASSLHRSCLALLRFIETLPAGLNDDSLPSLAFHLAQRQNHALVHRIVFSAKSVAELKAHLLAQVEGGNIPNDASSQTQKTGTKPVVLLFSGQTGRRAHLNRDAYTSFHLLRHHLDRCDRTLQTLGLRSLFPRIFDSDPLEDLVDLHCMQFALQYSVAASWIDSGLEIKALVGHSLGQLTALCVSGALSLADGLRMVSGRALLIQTAWKQERGCMLSVDADAATVETLAQSVSAEDKVEIACYNAALHQVVAGTEAAVAAFEDAAGSSGISTKRLAVTHAFHSKLLDDILPDYHRLLRSLEFHPARIPIEPCSEFGGGWDSVTPDMVGRQSREPVYFAAAVARVEQRLGSCVWLEVGSGSAAITMARRALESQKPSSQAMVSHSFYAAQLHSAEPVSSVADSTVGLWNEGVRVQFWLYHASQRQSFVPMDLPSYQFDKTQYWLPFIERNKGSDSNDQPASSQAAPDLVTLVGNLGSAETQAYEFSINQESDEYALFVKGRTVFGHFLAPGSVYAESAARAFALLPTDTPQPPASVELGQMKLHAPFGLDLQRRLRLVLRQQTASSWEFVVESCPLHDDKEHSAKPQASGTVRLQGQGRSPFGTSQSILRRLFDRCGELREDRGASVVQGAYVKKIMSRVASYDDRYFGIRFVASRGFEAVGDVDALPIVSQCRAGTALSPPVFDNFLLVAEMHAGSLGDLADDHLYICGGFEAIVPGDQTSQTDGPWTVLSTLERENEKTLVSDILVFHAGSKKLALSILGARLTQIPARSLQKTLDDMNTARPAKVSNSEDVLTPTLPAVESPPTDLSNGQIHRDLRSALSPLIRSTTSLSQLTSSDDTKDSLGLSSRPSITPASSATSENDQDTTALYNLLAEHLDCSNGIPPDMPLGNIGLDSLISIQLQSDLEKLFGKSPALKLIDENTTFLELCGMVLQQDLSGQLKSRLSPVDSANARTTSVEPLQAYGGYGHAVSVVPPVPVSPQDTPPFLPLAVEAFEQVKKDTGAFAQKTGFAGFYPDVQQKQTSLVLSYILEAFSTLGCDLRTLQSKDRLPSIPHPAKYQRLMGRLHDILEEAGIISPPDAQLFRYRTDAPLPPPTPSGDLYRQILEECPLYRPDHQLLGVTASRLADCISGRADPLQLLFQDQASLKLLEDVYVSSPMFSTGNSMLGEMLRGLFSQARFQREGGSEKLRILEIGAGTGATTRRVLDQLIQSGVDFSYTFTDISLALVNGSKRKFTASYGRQRVDSDMEFTVLDIERPPPASMLQAFHLVISSNCIHATRDLRTSCGNIEKLVRRGDGMLCLLELTRPLAWLDCVFGLLDGWWRFEDGRKYALAHEDEWRARLESAGFQNVDWTGDGSRESEHFRLITAWH
ncbi:polyketide synthase [Colletotrichum tabaci]|uniref:Polyketide synthase n=1 Tax=Colletotrichum tabaci TaxID=1209068 RepID=A0AAV9T8U4_9PEZI